ncbi:hypothetical protein [Xanthobacter sp. 91]|uniref:hypothetical protein n=1 Tax=Xanthobacter sp. 91 TaxID=1117244 RepID=UPI0009DDEBA6|nr:hypothetical protein [Xanthobacter sp. 91]
MFPKEGKKLPRGPRGSGGDGEFAQTIAAALRGELGTTHQAIKTAMRWTGTSERTVKHWFAGTHAPSGPHLASLARHSDSVLMCFLRAAHRPALSVGTHWISVRTMLVELVEAIDLHYGL